MGAAAVSSIEVRRMSVENAHLNQPVFEHLALCEQTPANGMAEIFLEGPSRRQSRPFNRSLRRGLLIRNDGGEAFDGPSSAGRANSALESVPRIVTCDSMLSRLRRDHAGEKEIVRAEDRGANVQTSLVRWNSSPVLNNNNRAKLNAPLDVSKKSKSFSCHKRMAGDRQEDDICEGVESKRRTVDSDFSVASFADFQYSSMVADWVDSTIAAQDQLMILSGSDFKDTALSPHHQALATPSSSRSCEKSSQSSCQDLKDSSFQALLEMGRNVGGSLASWLENSVECCESPFESPIAVEGKRTAKPLSTKHHDTIRTRRQRRNSMVIEASQWPSFSSDLSLVRSSLASHTFNALDFSPDDLAVVAAEIFFEMELDVHLNIPRSAIRSFVLSVRARMLDNPYHNWTHVVDVTQTVYSLAVESGVLETLSHQDRLVLLLAALCHDLEHPGVTAGYLVKSESTLAARYKKDQGLLEKHHSLRAFQLLAGPDMALLQSFTDADKRAVTAAVRDLIMATDMRRHGGYLEALRSRATADDHGDGSGGECPMDCSPKAKADRPGFSISGHTAGVRNGGDMQSAASSPAANQSPRLPSPSSLFSQSSLSLASVSSTSSAAADRSERLFHMQLLLKMADISNVTKPFPVAREWAVLVTDEFFAQGDLERRRGLPVTPMCDRATQSRAGLQRGFIDHVAGPFFRAAAQVLPRLEAVAERVAENRRAWEGVSDDELASMRLKRSAH